MTTLFPLVSWRRVTAASAPTAESTRSRWRTLQKRGLTSGGLVLNPRSGRALEGRAVVCSVLALDAAVLDRHGFRAEAEQAAEAAKSAEDALASLLLRYTAAAVQATDESARWSSHLERILTRLAAAPAEPADAGVDIVLPGVAIELKQIHTALHRPDTESVAETSLQFLLSWQRLVESTERARDAWRHVLPVTEVTAVWDAISEGDAILRLDNGEVRHLPVGSTLLDGFSLGDPVVIQQEITDDGVLERILPAVDFSELDRVTTTAVDSEDEPSQRPPAYSEAAAQQIADLFQEPETSPELQS